jgi:hypothetical protein
MILEIMTAIGGFFSFVSALIFIAISAITQNQWWTSVKNEVAKEEGVLSQTQEEREKLKAKIIDVVSFRGVYRLNTQFEKMDMT